MTTEPEPPPRTALILYGTETGTALDLAHELSQNLTRLYFSTVDVIPLDDLPHATTLHHYSISIFVIATTGQGDFPDNSRLFWKGLLRRKLGPETLRGVRYALVGLGDSSYLKFNWAGRKLGRRLKQLGAEELVQECEADEQGDEGIDGYYLEWVKGFRERVLDLWPLGEGRDVIAGDVPIPNRWRLCRADEEGTNGFTSNGEHGPTSPAAPQMAGSFPTVLEVNDRATPKAHWQDVRIMKLRAPGRHEYFPGDALAIMPENDPADVSTLIEHMSWQDVADNSIRLKQNSPTPTPTDRPSLTKPPLSITQDQSLTLRALLTTHLDISAIPRRSFFGLLAKYTSNEMHKERLLEFLDPQYLDEYFDYATRPRRSIIEVLQEFDSVKIPWHEAINIFPVLRARQFSIASAYTSPQNENDTDGERDETTFDLLVAIVKYKTVLKRIRQGVCTRYLARLPVGTVLQVSLRTEGRIATTRDLLARKHVLIGAGTGIAPLRSLILAKHSAAAAAAAAAAQQQFSHSQRISNSPPPPVSETARPGSTTLIFGARNKEADFFFAEDWAALASSSSLSLSPSSASAAAAASSTSNNPTHYPSTNDSPPFKINLITAFSRDQARKIYVQDRIREHAGTLAPLMRDEDAIVVVCGASGMMPKAVRAALGDVLVAVSESNLGKGGVSEGDGDGGEKKERQEAAAEEFLASMEREGRYKQETWS